MAAGVEMRVLLIAALLLLIAAFIAAAAPALASEVAAKTYSDGVCDGYAEALKITRQRATDFATFLDLAGADVNAPWVVAAAKRTVLLLPDQKQGCPKLPARPE